MSTTGESLVTRQFGSDEEDFLSRLTVVGESIYLSGSTNGAIGVPRGGKDGFLRAYSSGGKCCLHDSLAVI